MEDKYLTYSAVELAQEKDFFRWVKEEDEGLEKRWRAWLESHPERRETVAEARRIVRALAIKEEAIAQKRIDQLWNKIDAQTADASQGRVVSGRRAALRWLPYAAAAAIAFLLAFFFLYPQHNTVEVAARRGQLSTHALPDGSTTTLNAGSSIVYQPDSWAKTRRVELKGEAFFEVEKGAPFIVQTPIGQVEVLGTSFNVNTHGGQFFVECYTGSVQVTADGPEEVLNPGQSAKWLRGAWQLTTFEPGQRPLWEEGIFRYEAASLSSVFAELERQFNIEIEAPDSLLSRTYSGFFNRNQLDSALYRVCWPMGLEAEQNGQKVKIRPQ